MDQRIKKIIQDGDRLWSQRKSLDSLWQEIAYQFHVDMADFTISRYLGDDFADHLTTSYPLIARRTLGNSISALLRPVSLNSASPGVWFSIQTNDEEVNEDTEARRWLEYATTVQRRAMYDRPAGFNRATKEADHMFATFGQAPITLQLNKARDKLLYQTHHLRDVVWTESAENMIDTVYRKWKPTASQLYDVFGDKVAPQIKERLTNEPYAKMEVRHIVIDAEKYERRDATGKKFRTPWVSIWVDIGNDHVMEEIGSWSQIYVIPRWVTISGSQYASSPAVTVALPDARLIQAMTLTLLESGEKAADPPLIATQEAIRSDMQTFAGGTTWVDAEYDERLGDVLRPLYEPRFGEGLRVGFEMTAAVQEQIAKAFFLDSLSLPPLGVKEMTAFEVGERISEWIRRAMPIFEPIETEYNDPLCTETFELLLRNGAFGPLEDMPAILRGQSIQFKFESPLHESANRQKGQKFLEAKAALVQAAELDPGVAPLLNAGKTLRDVLQAIGVPADWTRTEREMEEIRQQQLEEEAMQGAMEGAGAGAEIAKNLGSAAKSFAEAGGQSAGAPVTPG
jgi:hypothetical protein